jgi:hypothetical protein
LPGTRRLCDISDGPRPVKRGFAGFRLFQFGKAGAMREILKSNNHVELNFAEVVLKDAGIGCVILDTHMSIMDGSMLIIPRRLMVADENEARARAILVEALATPAEWT